MVGVPPGGVERTTGTLRHGGEHIYFEVTTADPGLPALVLCHGLGGNHASWWQQVGVLGREFRVVTWDQRGFGNSTRRSGRYGPEVAVDDLVALVDHLGVQAAHVVGQSMGGWVAMGLALRAPARVASLTLTDTIAGAWTPEIEDLTAKSAAAAVSKMAPGALGRHVALGERFADTHPDLVALYQVISSMGDKPPDAEVFVMLAKTRFAPEAVASLAMPVLLVVGEHDELCPPEAMAALAAAIPGATLSVVEGCGHSPYFEDAKAWNRIVADFVLGRRVEGVEGAEGTSTPSGLNRPPTSHLGR